MNKFLVLQVHHAAINSASAAVWPSAAGIGIPAATKSR